MTIRWKLLIGVASLLAGLDLLLLALGQWYFLPTYVDLEQQLARENLERGASVYRENLAGLFRSVQDWAVWDDAYRFMQEGDPRFITSNLIDNSFTALRLNVILFLDEQGELVAGQGFDLTQGKFRPMPAGLLAEIDREKAFWSFRDASQSLKGLLILPEGPLLLAAHAILPGDGSGSARGALLMGRFLDREELARLAERCGLQLDFAAAEPTALRPEQEGWISGSVEVRLWPLDGVRLQGLYLLRDVYGGPALGLTAVLPRSVYNKGRQTIVYFNVWLLGVSLLAGVVLYLVWDRLLASRERQRESEQLFRHIFQESTDGFFLCDEQGRVMDVNRRAWTRLGYRPEELLQLSWEDIGTTLPLSKLLTAMESGSGQVELMVRCRDCSSFPAHIGISRVKSNGRCYFFILMRDLSEQREAERMLRENQTRLDFLAYHDVLTGLPNRLQAFERLAQALDRARRQGTMVALLLLDLDLFKNINDALGHDTGDEILVEVGRRLEKIVRESDFVARFGGDEFLVVVEGITDLPAARAVAHKVLVSIAEPFSVGEQHFYLTGSLGISLYPRHAPDAQSLLKCVDTAMYQAKEQGRNSFQFYTPLMHADLNSRLALENDLRQALEAGQLSVHYQPQYDLQTGQLIGLESLVRWQHPERGLLMPRQFIQVAEESGLIVRLGEEILRQACRQSMQWQAQGLPPLPVAVNISARQFSQPVFVDTVVKILEETALPPHLLELELTESMLMQSVTSTVELLGALRRIGVRLAIDDFGTGYSSLNYLKRFPFSRLKIDQSFVSNLVSDANDAAIVAAIIALGRSLRMEVLAEGIETVEQLEIVRRLGCRQGQGYLFARPLDAAATEALLLQVRAGRGLVMALLTDTEPSSRNP